MTRAEILDCLTDRPCDYCKFHADGHCSTWNCVFEEKPDDAEPCKVGCWIHTDECDEEWQYRCSICNMPSRSNAHRYCSKCGSYMYGIKPDDAEEDADNYENEIADLQNRLDIAEYDKDRFKEKVTVLEEKLKALSAKPCEDCISRQAAMDFIRGLPIWCVRSEDGKFNNVGLLYDDVMFGLDRLPSVTPKQKDGHWIKVDDEEPIAYDCSECVAMVSRRYRFCPNCGAKMQEVDE